MKRRSFLKETAMTRHTSEGNSALIPSDAVLVELATDAKAEKARSRIAEKYPHALTDQLWRHEKKIGVLIRCQEPGCSAQRFVHSSDLFQVTKCPDHKAGAKPSADEKRAKSGVRSKGGRKGDRKAPRARKGNGKARRASRKAPATSAE
jgi:hypothetical protein